MFGDLALTAAAAVLAFVPRRSAAPSLRPPLLELDAIEVAPAAPLVLAPEDLPREPGEPGTKWRDEKGRVCVVPSEPSVRHLVNPHEAALRFAAWLRDHEFTGWRTVDEIDGLFVWFCSDERLEEMALTLMRERLAAGLPGVVRERRRIGLTAEPEMLRLRQRCGEERPTLYRISSHEEMAEAAAAAEREAAEKTAAATAAKAKARAPAAKKTAAPKRQPARRAA